MLELRPSCENCNTPLPANSTKALICSYECTFCVDCVKQLFNVCPNCGGGFSPRPIRPHLNWKNNNYLEADPASSNIIFKTVNIKHHKTFSQPITKLKPQDR